MTDERGSVGYPLPKGFEMQKVLLVSPQMVKAVRVRCECGTETIFSFDGRSFEFPRKCAYCPEEYTMHQDGSAFVPEASLEFHLRKIRELAENRPIDIFMEIEVENG